MTALKFPPQPTENPFVREAKNQVCLRGHLSAAREALRQTQCPDTISAILTELAHQSVDIAVEVMQTTPLYQSIEKLKQQSVFYKRGVSYELRTTDVSVEWNGQVAP